MGSVIQKSKLVAPSAAKLLTGVGRIQARLDEIAARQAARKAAADRAAEKERGKLRDRVGEDRRRHEGATGLDPDSLDAVAPVLRALTPQQLVERYSDRLDPVVARRIREGWRLSRHEQLALRHLAASIAREEHAQRQAEDATRPGAAGAGTSLDTSEDVGITRSGVRAPKDPLSDSTLTERPVWADAIWEPPGARPAGIEDAGADGLGCELPVEIGAGPVRAVLVGGQVVHHPVEAAALQAHQDEQRREREARGEPDPRSLPARRPKAAKAVFIARIEAKRAERERDTERAERMNKRAIGLLLDQPEGEARDHSARAWLRGDFTEALMAQTRLHRMERARKLLKRGREVQFERYVAAGMTEEAAATRVYGDKDTRPQTDAGDDVHPGNTWHAQRARGARQKLESIRDCGLRGAILVRCTSCGHEQEVPMTCGDRLVCAGCRMRTALRYQDEFRRMRAGLYRAAEDMKLLWSRSRERKAQAHARGCVLFRERLITISAPHVEGDTVTSRIERMRKASARFLRQLRAVQVEALRHAWATTAVVPTPDGSSRRHTVHPLELCTHAAVDEWTAGSDGKGHPHVHIWHFGPYLDFELLRRMWREALVASDKACERMADDDDERRAARRAAGEHDPGPAPIGIVDVRAISDNFVDSWMEKGKATRRRERIDREIFKYLAKDWTADQERRVAPEVFAEVVIAFDGKRMRRCSVGWRAWCVALYRACRWCGSECAPSVRLVQYETGSIDEDRAAPAEPREIPTWEALTGPPIDPTRQALWDEVGRRWFGDLSVTAKRDLKMAALKLARALPAAPTPPPVAEQQLSLFWAGERV